MGIKEMREYMVLCLEGKKSIPERMTMLRKEGGFKKPDPAGGTVHQIYREKEKFYQDVQTGKIKYTSNLLPEEDEGQE